MAEITIRSLIEKGNLPKDKVQQVILGNVIQAGVGMNPARTAALKAGLLESTVAYTVNNACGSGMLAVINSVNLIRLNEADLVFAGGTESMSNAPFAQRDLRWGKKMGNVELIDLVVNDGLMDARLNVIMGEIVEDLAKKYKITRVEQDEFVLSSQLRYKKAHESGKFSDELTPVKVKNRRGEIIEVISDEYPRARYNNRKTLKFKTCV